MGGRLAPPLRHQFSSGGPVGQPHALPSGMSRAINNNTKTPSGRGSRAELPPGQLGPAPGLVVTSPHPWSPSRQGPLGGTQPRHASASLVARQTGGCGRLPWP
eukprot:scaffold23588_cov25-Tisochrysis_lutea.AAC.1